MRHRSRVFRGTGGFLRRLEHQTKLIELDQVNMVSSYSDPNDLDSVATRDESRHQKGFVPTITILKVVLSARVQNRRL